MRSPAQKRNKRATGANEGSGGAESWAENRQGVKGEVALNHFEGKTLSELSWKSDVLFASIPLASRQYPSFSGGIKAEQFVSKRAFLF